MENLGIFFPAKPTSTHTYDKKAQISVSGYEPWSLGSVDRVSCPDTEIQAFLPCLSGGCAIVITTGKKSSSRLSGGYAIIIRIGKKRSSHLSGGCTIIITTEKKQDTVICLVGAQSLLRPEKKKVLVVCLTGAQSLLRPEKEKF